jgi:dolichol kinase
MDQVLPGILTVFLAVGGLALAKRMRNRGVQVQWSRRLLGIAGGFTFLVAVLWLEAWTAVAITASLTGMIFLLRFGLGHQLEGVTSDGESQVWAEITYPAAGALSLAIGWGILGDRWLAFTPIAFMAWGDGASGMVREIFIWRRRYPSRWPSVAMLVACLASALFYQPYWIAAAAALTAAVTEFYSPRIRWIRDDNLSVVLASLAVMAGLTLAVG